MRAKRTAEFEAERRRLFLHHRPGVSRYHKVVVGFVTVVIIIVNVIVNVIVVFAVVECRCITGMSSGGASRER